MAGGKADYAAAVAAARSHLLVVGEDSRPVMRRAMALFRGSSVGAGAGGTGGGMGDNSGGRGDGAEDSSGGGGAGGSSGVGGALGDAQLMADLDAAGGERGARQGRGRGRQSLHELLHQRFYADLYLALWAEATGDVVEAERRMLLAAGSAYGQSGDYMHALAVVHVRLRGWGGEAAAAGVGETPEASGSGGDREDVGGDVLGGAELGVGGGSGGGNEALYRSTSIFRIPLPICCDGH